MKKFIAIFLALILMCAPVADALTVSADTDNTNTNLWTNITADDVKSFSGYGKFKSFASNTGTLVLDTIRYQSVYVVMPTLEPNTTYQLSMSYKVSSDEPQSGVQILNEAQLEEMKATGKFPSTTVATVFDSGASGSNDSCIFTTGTTTKYYMAIRCPNVKTDGATLTLSGIKLVKIPKYDIAVEGGTPTVDDSIAANAQAGTTVTVTADEPAEGMIFDHWKVVSGDVTLADPSDTTTTFTMPEEAVEIKAVYKTNLWADWATTDISNWFGTKATSTIPKGEINTSGEITRVKVNPAWYTCWYFKLPQVEPNTMYKLSFKYTNEKQDRAAEFQEIKLATLADVNATASSGNGMVSNGTIIASGLPLNMGNDVYTEFSCEFDSGDSANWVLFFNNKDKYCHTAYFTDFSLVVVSSPVTVEGGSALVNGDTVTKASVGTTVTVTANEPAEGKIFDHWEVVSNNVTLEDATAATTTFTMPEEAVKIKAVYNKTNLWADWATTDISNWFGTKATSTIPKGEINTSGEITRVKVNPAWYTCWYFKLPQVEPNTMYKLSFKYTNEKQDRAAEFQEIKLATLADVNATAASGNGMVSNGTIIASGLPLNMGNDVYTEFSCEFDSGDSANWVLFFNNKDKYCHTAYFTDFSLIEVTSNPVTIEDGSATVNGSAITKASVGTTVTVTANEPDEGMKFDHWEVVSGGVTLADSSAATTTFAMPNKEVTLRAVYRDAGAKIEYVTPNGTAYADKENLPKATTEIIETSADSHTVTLTYDTMDQINQFLGWYQGDTRLETALTYTYDPNEVDITKVSARILCRNVLTGAASFEGYENETNMRVEPIATGVAPYGDKWGLNNDSYETEGATFYIRTSGERETTYLTDVGFDRDKATYLPQDQMGTAKYTATPHSGDSMLQLSISGRAFVRKLDGLEPNTNYTLSFYVMNPDEYNFLTSAVVMDTYTEKHATLKVMSNHMIENNTHKIYGFYEADRTEELYETNQTLTDKDSVRKWQKISFTFTTEGDTDSLYLYLCSRNRNEWNNRCFIYVDDLVCYENVIPCVGNAIRKASDTAPQALRYKFSIPSEYLENEAFKKLGLLVMQQDYLGSEDLQLDVTYNSDKTPIDVTVNEENYQVEGENTYFTAALYNIGESVGKIDYKQYGTIFTVRPYVIYTGQNDAEIVVYGDPINASVFDVVYDIRDNANAQEDDFVAANSVLDIPAAKAAYAAWQPANGWNFTNENKPTEYDYSFAIVGDIQYTTDLYPEKLEATYDWLLNNQTAKKIEYVFGTGDITDHSTDEEYQAIDAQLQRLQGQIPQTIVRGNHDRIAGYDTYITQDKYRAGGDEFVSYDSTMKTYYRKITVEGIKYMMLALDYFPSEAEVTWAKEKVDENPDYNVIVTTHGYLDSNMTLLQDNKVYDVNDRVDAAGNKLGGVSGQYIYDELIEPCSNIVMVICGHTLSYGPEYKTLTRNDGSTAVQMLVNFQQSEYLDLCSYGMIAMLYFSNGGETVTVEWFSSIKNEYYMDKYQFTFNLSVK